MSPEIRTIATGLNRLADKLNVLIQSEKDSAEKVKNAEIAALEAQLNPHFLYNSLDTINWMAIEQEQYPISNVVSALGKILRYGIDNSNGIVTIADEQNWLNQYLFLHQNRLRNMLQCDVCIAEDTLGASHSQTAIAAVRRKCDHTWLFARTGVMLPAYPYFPCRRASANRDLGQRARNPGRGFGPSESGSRCDPEDPNGITECRMRSTVCAFTMESAHGSM